MSSLRLLEGMSEAERLAVESAFGCLSIGKLRTILISAARGKLARRAAIERVRNEYLTAELRREGGRAGARSRWRKPPSDV